MELACQQQFLGSAQRVVIGQAAVRSLQEGTPHMSPLASPRASGKYVSTESQGCVQRLCMTSMVKAYVHKQVRGEMLSLNKGICRIAHCIPKRILLCASLVVLGAYSSYSRPSLRNDGVAAVERMSAHQCWCPLTESTIIACHQKRPNT